MGVVGIRPSLRGPCCVFRVCCRITLYWIKRAACGGADVAGFVVLLACPLGPIPLAARGLTAVLARAGPAGAVVDGRPGRAGDADSGAHRERSESSASPQTPRGSSTSRQPSKPLPPLRGGLVSEQRCTRRIQLVGLRLVASSAGRSARASATASLTAQKCM